MDGGDAKPASGGAPGGTTQLPAAGLMPGHGLAGFACCLENHELVSQLLLLPPMMELIVQKRLHLAARASLHVIQVADRRAAKDWRGLPVCAAPSAHFGDVAHCTVAVPLCAAMMHEARSAHGDDDNSKAARGMLASCLPAPLAPSPTRGWVATIVGSAWCVPRLWCRAAPSFARFSTHQLAALCQYGTRGGDAHARARARQGGAGYAQSADLCGGVRGVLHVGACCRVDEPLYWCVQTDQRSLVLHLLARVSAAVRRPGQCCVPPHVSLRGIVHQPGRHHSLPQVALL